MEKIKGKRVRVAAGKRKTRTATVHFRTETSVTPEQRPSMLAAVSFRRTPVDSVDLVGTWEAIVGPAVFAASTLTEAQGIYDRGAQ